MEHYASTDEKPVWLANYKLVHIANQAEQLLIWEPLLKEFSELPKEQNAVHGRRTVWSKDRTVQGPHGPRTTRSIDHTVHQPHGPTTTRSNDHTVQWPHGPMTTRSNDHTVQRPHRLTTTRSNDHTHHPTTTRSNYCSQLTFELFSSPRMRWFRSINPLHVLHSWSALRIVRNFSAR